MKIKIKKLLTYCSEINFGTITLSHREELFCSQLSNEVILLCKSLPESTQTDTLLFLMKYLRTPFDKNVNFFMSFYAPAWSIIYWLIQSAPKDKRVERKDIKNAKTAHAMAVLLHPLDDHLNDNELPATHLTLLLRSQTWLKMNEALNSLAVGIDGGKEIVQDFIDDYYSSICSPKETESLDSYCDLFRKQMATWLIVPVLMSKMFTTNSKFTNAIQTAYGSFGIAWRLLDDIKDIESDMRNGIHSSIYVCIPDNIKKYWDKNNGITSGKKNHDASIILQYVLQNGIVDVVKERICYEMELAASLVSDYGMIGLAREFRYLIQPLEKLTNL